MGTQWPPTYDRTYIPAADAAYWNAHVETMDPQEREQKIILPKLKEQLKYAYKNSAFYKRKWDEAGVNPADILSLDDFKDFPARKANSYQLSVTSASFCTNGRYK